MREKNKNSYILLYEKVIKQCTVSGTQDSQNTLSAVVQKEMILDNMRYYQSINIMDQQLNKFIVEAVEKNMEKQEVEVSKLGVVYCLVVLNRKKSKKDIAWMVQSLQVLIYKDYELARWVVLQFTNPALLLELLVHCPVPDMKYLAMSFLKKAILKCCQYEGKLYDFNNFTNKSMLLILTHSILCLYQDAMDDTTARKLYPFLHHLLAHMLVHSHHLTLYLLHSPYIPLLLHYLLSQPPSNKHVYIQKSHHLHIVNNFQLDMKLLHQI